MSCSGTEHAEDLIITRFSGLSRVLLASSALLAAGTCAYAAAGAEMWSGVYRCGAMRTDSGNSSGYTAQVRMYVDGEQAQIIKRSAAIRENLTGRVMPDGTLRLEGEGERTDGADWRYRFDGRIEGGRYRARGAMYSANQGTTLRECTMTLSRMQTGERAAPEPAAFPQKPPPSSAPPGASASAPPSASSSVIPPAPTPPPVPLAARPVSTQVAAVSPPPVPAVPVVPLPTLPPKGFDTVRELDLRDRKDGALVEGTVTRGTPHLYRVEALRGSRLVAAIKSADGARVDLYEPGSTLTALPGGFMVQGARVGGTADGRALDVQLPADGRYLLLVRPSEERAYYTLDVRTSRSVAATLAAGLNANRSVVVVLVLGLFALIAAFVVRRRRRERRLFSSG